MADVAVGDCHLSVVTNGVLVKSSVVIRPALGSLVNREASAGCCSAGDDSQIYFIHFVHLKKKRK